MLVRYAYVNKPEIKYLKSGTVFNFSIAVKKYNSKTKKNEGIAAYYDVQIWGDEAETLADQLEDGDKISIETATLSSNSYEKDGTKYYRPLLIFPKGIEVHKKQVETETPF
jgi:single-stranded DNA-binding protein